MSHRVVHISSVHSWDDERVYGRELGTLVRAGYDVHWMAVDDNRGSGDTSRRSDVTLHHLPRRGLAARLIRSPGLARRSADLGAALYHIHDPELLPAAMSIRRRTGARIVYDKHEYQRGRRGAKAAVTAAVERFFAPRVDGVVVVECADASLGTVPQKADECVRPDVDGLNLERVEVAWLPNYPRSSGTSSLVRSSETSPPGEPIRLVYTGVLARERGLWFMLDLVEEMKRRGRSVELDLVGVCHRANERADFEAELRRRGMEHDIRLVGWTRGVPWQDLMREASRADVGLMLMDPRYRSWSNIPTKFYEYMSLGLPIVCTAYAGWMDFVLRWGCGVVVDPRNASSVADHVLEVVDSPETYAELSATGKQASTRFSWEAVEGRLVDLYRRLGVG